MVGASEKIVRVVDARLASRINECKCTNVQVVVVDVSRKKECDGKGRSREV